MRGKRKKAERRTKTERGKDRGRKLTWQSRQPVPLLRSGRCMDRCMYWGPCIWLSLLEPFFFLFFFGVSPKKQPIPCVPCYVIVLEVSMVEKMGEVEVEKWGRVRG